MNHIELFAGCGGLSLGLETAGFNLLIANELSPMASETFAYNHLNADLEAEQGIEKVFWVCSQYKRTDFKKRLRENPIHASGLSKSQHSDLLDMSPTIQQLNRSLLVGSIIDLNTLIERKGCKLRKQLKSGLGNGEVDLVSGGPPCQSFSLAGLRQHSNERNQLPWEFAKFVEHIQPRLALLENVSGILKAFKIGRKKYYAWFEVAKAFAKVGYIPLCLHVNAKYVGTAQNRPRFVLIALRKDVFNQFKANSKDYMLLPSLEASESLFNQVNNGNDPEYGSFKYIDVDRDIEAFSDGVLSALKTYEAQSLISVKDAIDDLRSSRVENSDYVEKLNSIYVNPYEHHEHKEANHEPRANGAKVKARFRLYQLMTNLPKNVSQEISNYLKTEGESGISDTALNAFENKWILDSLGNVIKSPRPDQILQLISELYTRKQTQKALVASEPAPAALSIPDDACHYHFREQRTLTVREMARIQSFPDWYEIKSKVTTGGQMRRFEVPQYTQIGNAVPPLLGLALGNVCKEILKLSDDSS